MMNKQLLILGAFLSSALAFSQCTITGKSSIKVPDEEVYTVETGIAQCKECYLWTLTGNKAVVIGNNKLNSVKIKANSDGDETLSLALLTPKGLVQCSKNIDIQETDKNSKLSVSSEGTKNCDIEVSDFKEVKSAEFIVNFFPNVTNSDYKYNWTVTYSDGNIMKSTEKIPQFPLEKEKGIISVKLQTLSKSCMKNLAKTYETGYWKHF